MNETLLKAALCKQMKNDMLGAVILRHEDKHTSGIPDISVTWGGTTVWLEVKHVTPRKPFKSRGDQVVTCQQLAKQGHCWYVIYLEHNKTSGLVSETLIIDPRNIQVQPWEVFDGSLEFRHDVVSEFVKDQC